MAELITFFIKGVIIGFSIAMPVGPVGFLCIQRAIQGGVELGLASGFGAAVADALYGLIAAFGLTFVSNFLTGNEFWFKLIGGIFLIILGVKQYFNQMPPRPSHLQSREFLGAFVSTFILTLTNPMTILAFAVIFAGFGLGQQGGNYIHASVITLGVFTGSGIWWAIISIGGKYLRERLTRRIHLMRKISASLIGVFGVLAILSLLLPIPV